MTVYEFVHGLGLQALADSMAEVLCRYVVFLKRPPMPGHSTPPIVKDG